MRTPVELLYLSRDLARFVAGRDYFRMRQPLGLHFKDSRCYYNDLTGKTEWRGAYRNGVPAVYVPRLKQYECIPVMILHYGLGCIDRYFLESNRSYLRQISNVAEWLVDSMLPDGYWASGVVRRDAGRRYYSDNSAMVQGEALSFGTRAIRHKLLPPPLASKLETVMECVAANTMKPLDDGGVALRRGEDLYFCEFCWKDEVIVLNGWIFAIFGLMDYADFANSKEILSALDRTLATLRKSLDRFTLPNGWSYYDDGGRIASPPYHELHIHLLEALFRLTSDSAFGDRVGMFQHAYTPGHRLGYTLTKIRDKLRDDEFYTSQR